MVLGVPHSRRFITRRFWCVLARHRLQRLCYEARLHTRAGRLPLILWTRPTQVGERTWLLCRAGISAEDFEDRIGELAAACYARDARVTRNRRWSHLVTIDIIRRDTLAASQHHHLPAGAADRALPAPPRPGPRRRSPRGRARPGRITPIGGPPAHARGTAPTPETASEGGTRNDHSLTPGRWPPVPTFPFSMFDPVHLGQDEYGEHVYVNLAERNMLLGGEPGAGKSSGLNLITAHGALSHDCKLILVDGKQVELGPWRACADMFIGPSIKDAIDAFEAFQAIMNTRYDDLLAAGRRKITRESGEPVYLIVIDEYAYFSATVGIKKDREDFAALTRDLVARGRAAGVIIILATQRPSHQVIDPSMRDLFGYRWAFRCTTDSSSDTVLGQGWAIRGLHRRRHRPAGPRGRLAAVRDRHPAPDQGRLPHRRRHQIPGRLRGPAARPGRRMNRPARPERATTARSPAASSGWPEHRQQVR